MDERGLNPESATPAPHDVGGREAFTPHSPPLGGREKDTEPAIAPQVWALAWPVLLQYSLVLTVTLSDRLLAGRFLQVDQAEQLASQAAQTTGTYLGWFVGNYCVLVTVGGTALVARFVGAKDRASALHAANQSLLLAVLLGLAGPAFIPLLPALTGWLQLDGLSASLAVAYLWPLLLFLPFQAVEQAGLACLVGAGDTRTGMWVLGGVALVNLPLAWGFFLLLGFPGIALGTAISHVLGAAAVLAVLARGRAGLRIEPRLLLPHGGWLRRLLRISLPAGLDSLSVAVAQLWFVAIVNRLGPAAGGAHGIALGWEALGYLSGAAFGTAAMTLVGQNLGAGRPDRASRCGWTAFAMGAVVMVGMGVVFYVLAWPMFWVFCPQPEQQPIVELGVPVLRLIAFAMPAVASCMIFTAALRGAGDTRVPVLFTWLGFFAVRIPLALWLTSESVGLGLLGAWVAMVSDLAVRGVFFAWRFAHGGWQRVKV